MGTPNEHESAPGPAERVPGYVLRTSLKLRIQFRVFARVCWKSQHFRIGEGEVKAEALVPRTHVWWTVLALAADPSDQFDQIRFVDRFSGASEVLIIDSRLIDRVTDIVNDRLKVIILLWDGYQSYLDVKKGIETVTELARQTELRVVGDLWADDQRNSRQRECRHLFGQSSLAYDKNILHSRVFKNMVFHGPLKKLAVKYRSHLLSLKVLIQLIANRRLAEYQRTSFVFCGQSGLYTLRRMSGDFGIDPEDCKYGMGGLECDREFLLRWIAAIVRKRENWKSRVAARALLRLIALRKLRECMYGDIFLNIFPEANVNAYQAGAWFRNHVFLDFGGINGDEPIYPRAADNLFHRRKTLRFSSELASRRLLGLTEVDSATVSEFVTLYEEEVVSTPQILNANAFRQPSATLNQSS